MCGGSPHTTPSTDRQSPSVLLSPLPILPLALSSLILSISTIDVLALLTPTSPILHLHHHGRGWPVRGPYMIPSTPTSTVPPHSGAPTGVFLLLLRQPWAATSPCPLVQHGQHATAHHVGVQADAATPLCRSMLVHVLETRQLTRLGSSNAANEAYATATSALGLRPVRRSRYIARVGVGVQPSPAAGVGWELRRAARRRLTHVWRPNFLSCSPRRRPHTNTCSAPAASRDHGDGGGG